MIWPPFIGPSSTARSPVASIGRTVNFYLERLPPGGKVEWMLLPTPGVTALVSPGVGKGRGIFYQNGRLFCVIDATFYEVSSAWALTNRGTVANDADNSPVRITGNGDGGNQLFITSAGVGYVYDLSANTLTTVLAGGAHQCGMLDGFVWVLDRDTSTLQSTPLLDATSIAGTQQRDMAPDPWRSALTMRRQILLCGEHSSEIWYDAGTSPFPFAPHPSGGFGIGIAAVDSLAAIGDGAIWLAQTQDGRGDVVLLEGSSPRSVAPHHVRTAIEGYGTIDDAIGDVYEEEGHVFYVLTFPTEDVTWVYDVATHEWHERGSWISAAGRYEAWRPTWHTWAFDTHVWLDRNGGALYESSLDVYTDINGETIRRVRRGPHLWQDNDRLFFPRFELLVEAGLGLSGSSGTPGVDPQVELRYSNDGGKTWTSAGLRSAGVRGNYTTYPVWNRLGSGIDRVYEVVMTDPIPWRVLGAIVEAMPGTRRGAA